MRSHYTNGTVAAGSIVTTTAKAETPEQIAARNVKACQKLRREPNPNDLELLRKARQKEKEKADAEKEKAHAEREKVRAEREKARAEREKAHAAPCLNVFKRTPFAHLSCAAQRTLAECGGFVKMVQKYSAY
jgi:Skp family chaperone for outer membrane proteins